MAEAGAGPDAVGFTCEPGHDGARVRDALRKELPAFVTSAKACYALVRAGRVLVNDSPAGSDKQVLRAGDQVRLRIDAAAVLEKQRMDEVKVVHCDPGGAFAVVTKPRGLVLPFSAIVPLTPAVTSKTPGCDRLRPIEIKFVVNLWLLLRHTGATHVTAIAKLPRCVDGLLPLSLRAPSPPRAVSEPKCTQCVAQCIVLGGLRGAEAAGDEAVVAGYPLRVVRVTPSHTHGVLTTARITVPSHALTVNRIVPDLIRAGVELVPRRGGGQACRPLITCVAVRVEGAGGSLEQETEEPPMYVQRGGCARARRAAHSAAASSASAIGTPPASAPTSPPPLTRVHSSASASARRTRATLAATPAAQPSQCRRLGRT